MCCGGRSVSGGLECSLQGYWTECDLELYLELYGWKLVSLAVVLFVASLSVYGLLSCLVWLLGAVSIRSSIWLGRGRLYPAAHVERDE